MGRLNEVKEKFVGKARNDNYLIRRIHHVLMKEYGWIPIDEFRKIPLPTLWGLLEEIEKDHLEEQKAFDKAKRK